VDVGVVSVRREPLDAITAADVAAEGFPDMTPAGFVDFFCDSHKGCEPGTEAARIEWGYLGAAGQTGQMDRRPGGEHDGG
jgi:hypothetical protein